MDSYEGSSEKPREKASLASIAALVAGGAGDKPVIVRFVNDRALAPEDRKDKALAKAVQDSQSLIAVFDMMDQDLSMTARLFRLLTVSVADVGPKSSPAVNRLNAPVVVVLDADGKLVKAVGPGPVRKGDLMPALAKALQSRMPLDKLLAEEKWIMKELMDIENLKATLDSKRTQSATAKGVAVQKLETEIQDLEKKVSEREAALQEREARLYGKS